MEYLIGYEGNVFVFMGNVEEDLLSIILVYLMCEDVVVEFLEKVNVDWSIVEKFLKEGKLIEFEYNGKRFYMRRLKSRE